MQFKNSRTLTGGKNMKKTLTILFLVIILLSFSKSLYANNEVYPIEVISGNYEKVILEENFIYSVKENIRKAINLKLSNSGPRLIIKIDTYPKDPDYPNDSIIYSVIWLVSNESNTFYLENTIGYTGKLVYENTSKNIVAKTDQILNQ